MTVESDFPCGIATPWPMPVEPSFSRSMSAAATGVRSFILPLAFNSSHNSRMASGLERLFNSKQIDVGSKNSRTFMRVPVVGLRLRERRCWIFVGKQKLPAY